VRAEKATGGAGLALVLIDNDTVSPRFLCFRVSVNTVEICLRSVRKVDEQNGRKGMNNITVFLYD